jgi:hypothetical protein
MAQGVRMMELIPPDNPELRAAYEYGKNEGVMQGRHEAAEALLALTCIPSQHVRAEVVNAAEGVSADVWLSALHAVSVARGDL